MFNLGKILKEKREKKLLTIQEVAQITKIKEIYIEALEKESINELPQRVYTIGFIQNLAALYQIISEPLIVSYDILLSKSNTEKQNEKNIFYIDSKNEENFNSNKKKESNIFYSEKKYTDNIFDKKKENLQSNKTNEQYCEKNLTKDLEETFIQDKELLKMKDQVAKKAEKEVEKDFPTSKIVIEFESLMKEEEKSQTQKIKKQLLEQNIQKTRYIKRNFFNKENINNKGPLIMLISLLITAFILLMYIIITALFK